MFLFKKTVSQLFFPLPLCLLIAMAGMLLLWFTRKQTAGKILVTAGICALALLSFDPVSSRLLAPLEYRYSACTPNDSAETAVRTDPVRFVVVLGGGHCPDPDVPLTSRLNDSSLARLIEGITLYRRHPDSRLVVSGGAPFGKVPEADTMRAVALNLGVTDNAIITETESRDTKDQARLIKSIVGDASFILVTSASHMPRSLALFNKQGMNPVPAPTGHLIRKKQGPMPADFFPNARSLNKAERAAYEYLGMIWAALRGLV